VGDIFGLEQDRGREKKWSIRNFEEKRFASLRRKKKSGSRQVSAGDRGLDWRERFVGDRLRRKTRIKSVHFEKTVRLGKRGR